MATIALQKKMNAQMTELQVKSDFHTRQMIMEKKRLDDLDEALKQADEQIKTFRLSTKKSAVDLLNQHRFTAKPAKLRTDGIDPTKLAETSRFKLIASLENRLNNMLKRKSLTETQNEKIKAAIDSMRRGRLTANKSHEDMNLDIRETQREVREVLERSQQVAELRERGVEQLHETRRQNEEEAERFADQMASLSEYIERQNQAFEESLMVAAQDTSGNSKKGVLNEDEEPLTRGKMTIAEEKMKLELCEELEAQIERERQATRQTQEKIALYGKSFDELKRVSGIDDLVEIVGRYVASEEETFSLFNYVQALNQETDWTLERHARLEEEIKSYEEKLSEEEALRAEAMAELQEKWRSAKEATDECAHAAAEAQRTLERIAKKIQSLFFKIQCDQVITPAAPATSKRVDQDAGKNGGAGAGKAASGASSSSAAKGPPPGASSSRPDSRLALLSGQGVTESNIVAYAELIEHRALEIMSEYTRKTHAAEQRRVTPVLDPSKSLDPMTPHEKLKPPEIENQGDDDDDDMDLDGRPIKLDEMRRRTAEKLIKKQQQKQVNAAARRSNAAANANRLGNAANASPKKEKKTETLKDGAANNNALAGSKSVQFA